MKIVALIILALVSTVKISAQHIMHHPVSVGTYQVYEYGDDYYLVVDAWRNPHEGVIMFSEPQGAFVQIFKGRRLLVQGTGPLSAKFVMPGKYTIIVRLPGGFVWGHTFYAKPGFKYIVGFTGGYVNDGSYYPEPVSDYEFAMIMSQLRSEPFSSNRLRLLKSIVASGHYFTVNQAMEIARLFEFDSYRLRACKVLFPALIYPQDAYMLTSVFEFDSTKRRWLYWLREQGY